jgi:P pilus assembly chaperone PapD
VRYGFAAAAICWSLVWCSTVAIAQIGADLNLSPKRVVMKAADRTASVFIYNRGTTPARYSIDLVDRAMTPSGDIVDVDSLSANPAADQARAKLKSAKPMLIFTPRRVTLAGGESQVVRIRALRAPDLDAGEYRTTLTVTALPPDEAGFTAEQAASLKQGEIAMRVATLLSLSIPVIVRQGPVEASLRIANAQVTPSGISALLARQGSASLYGTLEVRKGNSSGELLGTAKGLGVYPEVESRLVSLPLSPKPRPGATIILIFRDEDQKPGEILATESLVVP